MAMDAYSTNLSVRTLILSLFCSFLSFSQSIEVQTIAELPEGLDECSGMTAIGENALVMINDSGNNAELFICDTLGSLISRVALIGLPNRDWESICSGPDKLFIGDFGNNANKRQNLEILVLDVSGLLKHQEWSLEGRISFNYPEQKNFPPIEKKNYYYDLEAMIYERDSLFLFTKNRTKPFDGLVKVYGLSTQIKKQEARLIKEFKTGIGLKHFNWVSGASLGPKGDDLFLLGYSKVWYCDNWRQSELMELHSFSLGDFSQKEALCLKGKYLFFGEERNPGNNPKLKKMRVALFREELQGPTIDSAEINLLSKRLKSDESLIAQFKRPFIHLGCAYRLYNTQGELMTESRLSEKELKTGVLDMSLSSFYPGRYILSFDGPYKRAFVLELE